MFVINGKALICARSHWSAESPTNISEEKKHAKGYNASSGQPSWDPSRLAAA